MKTCPKVVFLALAAVAASASAESLWQNVHEPLDELESADFYEEEVRQFDTIQITPEQIISLEQNEHDEFEVKEKDKSSGKSTKKPTKKPTSSSSSKSTKKPTRKPTKKPSGSSSKRCVDDKKPSAKRNGEKYKFELEGSNKQCVDKKNRRYEYGEFKKIKKFSKCADVCVKDVRSSLLENFRGFDWDCKKERCRCLYDEGTLDSRNSGNFERTNRNEEGSGRVRQAKKKDDMYCGKLTDVTFDGMSNGFDGEENEAAEMEGRRVLRGRI